MKLSVSGLVPVAIGSLLVVGVTAVQGVWTERWSGRNVRAELQEAAGRLEARFPGRFGSWEFAQELASDPEQLARAGAVGHISRSFTNRETGASVSAFIVCATPHDASGHTPDRCYPGAGFEIAEAEHRQSIPLEDGRTAETFTGTFRKTGQTLRVFWTYGIDGRWIAPQIARIELAGSSAVYKLYAIIDETRLQGGEATVICGDFLSALLPEFDAAMFDRTPGAAGSAAASPTGADRG
ncbi:MAG: exosortase-associated EpsI family protein [Planctomycetia bacterium]|nr:exosortase-associated EpsI family protein [Planctomycetia bacterium]